MIYGFDRLLVCTGFTLWLFTGVTDFGPHFLRCIARTFERDFCILNRNSRNSNLTMTGFQGGSVGGSGAAQYLTPSYDFGAPVTESGSLRPLYGLLQAVLAKHGATVGT